MQQMSSSRVCSTFSRLPLRSWFVSNWRRNSSTKKDTLAYPRGAVSATIQWTCPETNQQYYLLIQRKNPPDQYKWSIPGGKIELGETLLTAAKREIAEETQIEHCDWHRDSFFTTDAIVADESSSRKDQKSYLFHYIIAHCFARAKYSENGGKPKVVPSDDALDAKWFTLKEVQNLDCSYLTPKVLQRAEALSGLGQLPITDQ